MTDNSIQRRYQGYGTVEGILELTKERSTLLIGDSLYPVRLYIPVAVRKGYQPGQVKQYSVFPVSIGSQPGFQLLRVCDKTPIPLKLKGCWEWRGDAPRMVIYRNTLDSPNDRKFRNIIPVVWENAPPPDRQFWELEIEARESTFVVVKADGSYPPPPKAIQFTPKARTAQAKTKAPRTSTLTETPSVPALTIEEILAMATPVKI